MRSTSLLVSIQPVWLVRTSALVLEFSTLQALHVSELTILSSAMVFLRRELFNLDGIMGGVFSRVLFLNISDRSGEPGLLVCPDPIWGKDGGTGDSELPQAALLGAQD